jgi:hypothetical protein
MNTAHRMASHAKRQTYPNIPKFWQPKVPPNVQTTAQIIHHDLIASFITGKADESILWDWVEAGLTYSEMMRLMQVDGTEFTPESQMAITELLEIQPAVVKRFRVTGRVGFSGTELNVARAGAFVMDELITLDRHGIAWAAREWSNAEIVKIKRAGAAALACV